MKRYQICLILLCAIEYSLAAVYPTARIPLTGVTYSGIIIKGVESFLNIPFGKDTGGSGRFAPPQPYTPASNSTICATTNGPACPQQKVPLANFPLFSNVTWASEDCLNLRIARPLHTATDAKLPVMVYIFGGKSNHMSCTL
jgi:carboxylesterase type B